MPQREKSTCTRMLQSTCDNIQIQPENLDCCFRQQTVHHIFTTSWKIAGSRHASSRWGWMRKAWVGIRSSDFVKTWLRGARCLEDINNFWMAHKPKTMSEVYSHLHEELEMRLAEAERVGYGFTIPKVVVPSVPRFSGPASVEIAA